MKVILGVRRYFRVAKPAGFAWNYTKTLAQTAVLWTLFLFVVPWWIGGADRPWASFSSIGESQLVAIAGFGAFSALGLWAGFVMAKIGHGTPLPLDSAPVLVAAGPYRYVRNPMAISAPAQILAVSFWLDSSAVLIYGLAAAFFWNEFIRPPEELDLEERFGDDYLLYKQQVRCWVPRFPGPKLSPQRDL